MADHVGLDRPRYLRCHKALHELWSKVAVIADELKNTGGRCPPSLAESLYSKREWKELEAAIYDLALFGPGEPR